MDSPTNVRPTPANAIWTMSRNGKRPLKHLGIPDLELVNKPPKLSASDMTVGILLLTPGNTCDNYMSFTRLI
ncbi:hypothetical protein COCCADRAFT_8900 [Bipolaris zeicola 26-R-13]|uniref:Uncharacterized protein n=1 Tax=Cochliobolus carbonum (strain 26-R-13) TaxID=930089 RepID=W6XUE8_COCC2|nr:uncharacterized protein COCCADRAFT_8900 [Bipolaris zeicola 26-R-13]EUC28795.1 hypothetical protein COCCADRAFT_8900 [Bipolaris zeicola 26-R-13]